MKFSPSPNLINEKGILHEIKSVKKRNSFTKSNGCVLFLSLLRVVMQSISFEKT